MNFYLCALIHFLHITFGVFGEAWAECLDKRDCSYPSLANATADELQNGLQKGCFTSVDMVNVCTSSLKAVDSN